MTACSPPAPGLRRPPGCRRRESQALQRRWLEQLAFASDRLDDQRVQLWLGIFPVSWRQLQDPTPLERQIATIRRCLSGTYTGLLQAMVMDPALQISLNGPQNRRGRPNENLARELLELFSLGEGHYSEKDVIEASRALTGYTISASGELVLNPGLHDDGPHTILGRRASFDAPSLAAWLCEQPATALNIIRRLWPSLVGPTPRPGRLESLAAAWRQQQLSLPWLMSALQQSPEATAARGLRLDSPITMVTRSLVLLGSRHPDAFEISRVHLNGMGQDPFDPPSVKGWPSNTEWINLRWLEARQRGLRALLADEEVWASRQTPEVLAPSLTPIPPLSLALPAAPTRDNLALLFADPVWQLS